MRQIEEQWKDVKGYEGLYQVSNLGRVKSFWHKKESILIPADNGIGYYFVVLTKNNEHKKHYLHRLVAAAFLPNEKNYPEINHINENKKDNRVCNLEWCDCKYNRNYGTRIDRIKKQISKVVLQYDLNMNFIHKYDSLSEASKKNGVNLGCISLCCKGHYKTAGGFVWRYANEFCNL